MNMENQWNDTDMEKLKYSKINLPYCHAVHHKCHMNALGANSDFLGEKPATNFLCYGMA
jgi:hypothetical protein